MKKRLIIESQNNFCGISCADATADIQWLVRFMVTRPPGSITVTLNSHSGGVIKRTTFGTLPEGSVPAPFWCYNTDNTLTHQLAQWQFGQQHSARKVRKGEYPLTEHFDVFETDTHDAPIPELPKLSAARKPEPY